MKKPTVFISYSRTDGEFAHRLADDLRARGYEVWIDISGLRGGEIWVREIQEAVEGCDVFILILSPDSVESEWVRNETIYAQHFEKPLVPIMWRDVPLPIYLVNVQYVDFRREYDEALGELYDALPPPERDRTSTPLPSTAEAVPGPAGEERRTSVAQMAATWLDALRQPGLLKYLPIVALVAVAVVALTFLPDFLASSPPEAPIIGRVTSSATATEAIDVALASTPTPSSTPRMSPITSVTPPASTTSTPVPSPTMAQTSTPSATATSTETPSPTETSIATRAPSATPTPAVSAVFSESGGEGQNLEVFVRKSDGSVVNVTNHPGADAYPSLSPDGRRIVFASTRDGPTHIFVMDVDGSNLTRLTDSSIGDTLPAWSPDGTQILYQTEVSGPNWDIFVMRPDGSGKTNLTENPAIDISAAWSPDGAKIVFETDRDGDHEIYVMNRDGSQPTNLTNEPGAYDISPRWSSDGTQIFFRSDRGRERFDYQPYVMDADGSNVRPVEN